MMGTNSLTSPHLVFICLSMRSFWGNSLKNYILDMSALLLAIQFVHYLKRPWEVGVMWLFVNSSTSFCLDHVGNYMEVVSDCFLQSIPWDWGSHPQSRGFQEPLWTALQRSPFREFVLCLLMSVRVDPHLSGDGWTWSPYLSLKCWGPISPQSLTDISNNPGLVGFGAGQPSFQSLELSSPGCMSLGKSIFFS